MVAGVTGLLRTISFGIDMIIFSLVEQVTWLFSMLTEATIFTQEQMKAFSTRIYVLVSIIMLFKLGFSFINYIVNPDTISDKQKGGGKLIVNIVIVVGLLVSVPTIFNEAYHLQQVVFKNNIIDRILLGTAVNQQQTVERSQILSTYAFLSFYRPTIKVTECRSNKGLDISEECIKYLDNAEPDKKAGTAYQQSLEESNLGKLRDNGSVNITAVFATGNNNDFYQAEQDYVFDYHYIISTIFGCILAYIMIGFCLDMAIRAVKMGFLQIIAPIPILLSLTPGTKNNTLNNWAKECLTTWASVFIRVAVISFALSAILLINEGGGVISIVSGGSNSYFMVNIFVMLGILLFAKEFPKLLEDILGIKNSGKITFNPLKKAMETPLVGGAIGKSVAYAGAGTHWIGNALKNTGLRFGEKLLGDRFKGLSSEQRLEARRDRWRSRVDSSSKEFEGRAHSDPTKKYSGDTQNKLIHKHNLEEREASRKAEREQSDLLKQQAAGAPIVAKIKSVEDAIMAKLRVEGQISSEDVGKMKELYQDVYKGNKQYGELSSQLAMAKNKGVYEKQQLSIAQAELDSATNPQDRSAAAARINEINKNIKDSDDSIKEINTQLERIGKTDTTAAKIAAQINAAKAAPSAYQTKYTATSNNESGVSNQSGTQQSESKQ